MPDDGTKGTCFVARPMAEATEGDYGHRGHWSLVETHIVGPALEASGFEMKSPEAQGATMIHGSIIRALKDAELVLADLSQLNPNVLFEAGVRTSANKPLVVIAEHGTSLPFDTAGINTFFYDPSVRADTVQQDVKRLAEHVRRTDMDSNALWRHFGVEDAAAQDLEGGDPGKAQVALLLERLEVVTQRLERGDIAPHTTSRRSWQGEPGGRTRMNARSLRLMARNAELRSTLSESLLECGVPDFEHKAAEVMQLVQKVDSGAALEGAKEHSMVRHAQSALEATNKQEAKLVLDEVLRRDRSVRLRE